MTYTKHPARIAADKALAAAFAKANAAKTDEEAIPAWAAYAAAVKAACEADAKYPTYNEIRKDNRRRYLASIGLGN